MQMYFFFVLVLGKDVNASYLYNLTCFVALYNHRLLSSMRTFSVCFVQIMLRCCLSNWTFIGDVFRTAVGEITCSLCFLILAS